MVPEYVLHACRVARGLNAQDPSQDPEIATLDPRVIYTITVEAFGVAGCAQLIEAFIKDCGGSIVWQATTVATTCQACGDSGVERGYYAGYGWREQPCPYCTPVYHTEVKTKDSVRAYTSIDAEPTGGPQTGARNK